MSDTATTELRIGTATVTRIEESYEANFEARTFFADWTDTAIAPHLHWLAPAHDAMERDWLRLSVCRIESRAAAFVPFLADE